MRNSKRERIGKLADSSPSLWKLHDLADTRIGCLSGIAALGDAGLGFVTKVNDMVNGIAPRS